MYPARDVSTPMKFVLNLYHRLLNRLRDRDTDATPSPGLFERLFSLKSLLAMGFVVTMIPVIIALSYAALGMRETAVLGENALNQTVERMKVMRVALQRANDIERKAKLYVLLSDPSLRQPYEKESYENVRTAFRQTLNELLQQSADNRLTLLINELLEKERLIHDQIVDAESSASPKLPVEEAFRGLRDAANGLWHEVTGRVDSQVEALHQQAQVLEQRMLMRTATLMSVSVGFFLLFLMILNRSIRQLDSSIRKLGAGRFAEAVSVKGPLDMRRLGDRLEWLRTRLLNLEESKQEFMHNVSREIEEPLAALSTDTERLTQELAETGESELRLSCQRMNEQVRKLQTVSEELVRYSRISENPVVGERKRVELKSLLDGVIADYQGRVQAKSLRIKALIQRVELYGMADQLCGIFDQLLSNAVKFSPEGGEIRVMLRTAAGTIELEVEDDGPGIPADEREQALKPFFRGKAALDSDAEGTGLGLAIVSEYLNHCQGRIEIVEPRQDHHGARIRIQIPLIEVD